MFIYPKSCYWVNLWLFELLTREKDVFKCSVYHSVCIGSALPFGSEDIAFKRRRSSLGSPLPLQSDPFLLIVSNRQQGASPLCNLCQAQYLRHLKCVFSRLLSSLGLQTGRGRSIQAHLRLGHIHDFSHTLYASFLCKFPIFKANFTRYYIFVHPFRLNVIRSLPCRESVVPTLWMSSKVFPLTNITANFFVSKYELLWWLTFRQFIECVP